MNNEIEKINNIKRSCKISGTVVNIVRIFTIICSILTLVGTVLCALFSPMITDVMAKHPEIVENSNFNVHFFGMDLTATGFINSGLRVTFACLFAFVILLCVTVILHQVRKCFLILAESETPFTEEVLATLKKAFIFIVIFTLITTGLVAGGFMTLIFWCVYNIFQYGHVLQQQADETL